MVTQTDPINQIGVQGRPTHERQKPPTRPRSQPAGRSRRKLRYVMVKPYPLPTFKVRVVRAATFNVVRVPFSKERCATPLRKDERVVHTAMFWWRFAPRCHLFCPIVRVVLGGCEVNFGD